MITPILEKLLLEQKAVYKTHNHGLGGVGTIFNPQNRTIIVTDITYYSFIDGVTAFENKFEDMERFLRSGRFIHTLKLHAKQNICNYTFKDNFKLNLVGNYQYILPAEPIKQDCFFVANEDIHINIKGMDYTNIPNVFQSVSPPSLEEQIPLGYGTSNDTFNLDTVINSAFSDDFGTTFNYFPVGNRDAAALGTSNQKLTDFIALNKLVGGSFKKGNNNFPILTFGYVELNAKYKIADILNTHK